MCTLGRGVPGGARGLAAFDGHLVVVAAKPADRLASLGCGPFRPRRRLGPDRASTGGQVRFPPAALLTVGPLPACRGATSASASRDTRAELVAAEPLLLES